MLEDDTSIRILTCCRYFLAELCFETVDIFEQNSTVGGAWNYSQQGSSGKAPIPQVSPIQPLECPVWEEDDSGTTRPIFLTPMYDNLETNIPKSLMKYSDKSFPSESPLFPHRTLVTEYLEDYAAEVRHLIKFEIQVLDIRLMSPNADRHQWKISTLDLRARTRSESVYDAVAICNGHYTVPYIPDIPGIRQWNEQNTSLLSHSKFYRHPGDYTGKKVIVVGNGASGLDIASQISLVSKNPLLVSTRSDPGPWTVPGGLKEEIPQIVEFLPQSSSNRGVLLADGRIEDEIDAVLFCTGYLYSYPFMSTLHEQLIGDGFRVQHVYQHIFHIEHPSLAFLALPMRILPFPLSEAQAAVVARVWSGRLELPSKAEMYVWEDKLITEAGAGKGFHTLNFPKDFEYSNFLHDWAAKAGGEGNKMPHRWSKKEAWVRQSIPSIKAAFARQGEKRHAIRTIEELGFEYAATIPEDLKTGLK